ncbi:MAG: electron transporter RnfD [Oscillospiraceae bacterium]|nr:electron transporter RnfD [Oscillospiraceae bacterium]
MIDMNDKRLSYMGRTDRRPDGAYFYYASSQVTARFTGTRFSVTVCNKRAWGEISIGYIIDGRMGRLPLPKENDGRDTVYLIADCLEPDCEHIITVYKRMSANHSYAIRSMDTDGEFLPYTPHYRMKLEFYGDSVSAGEVTEAEDFTGRPDPPNHGGIYDNSYHSYTWQCARLLDAEFYNISQGGISVSDGMGYFHMPDTIGMENVYDKLCYFPEGGEITEWDFSSYTPDAVIFALGQNDHHNAVTDTDDVDIYDSIVRRRWKDNYKKLVKDVAAHYGRVKIIMLTTVLMHDAEWDRAIDEIVSELCAEGADACHFMFKHNGAVTPGHPRRSEHTEMAKELAAFIEKIL